MRLQLQIGSRACVMDMEPGEQDGQFRGILDGQATWLQRFPQVRILMAPRPVDRAHRGGRLGGGGDLLGSARRSAHR